jgi:hypothetical protein
MAKSSFLLEDEARKKHELLVGAGLGAALLLGLLATLSLKGSRPQQLTPRPKDNAANLLTLARSKVGQKYILGANVPKSDPTWAGPWDCAEFATWLVYQATGRLVGVEDPTANPATAGSWTGLWAQAATRGTQGLRQISVDQAIHTPGAFLLRVPQPGVYGHIALSDGRGGTIEAMNSQVNVTTSRSQGRSWDMGVLVDGVQSAART